MIFGGRSFHVESNRTESHIIDLHLCSPDMYKDMVEGRVSSAPYESVSSGLATDERSPRTSMPFPTRRHWDTL
jgi:hypothetical protein